jgi:hypothetical protein
MMDTSAHLESYGGLESTLSPSERPEALALFSTLEPRRVSSSGARGRGQDPLSLSSRYHTIIPRYRPAQDRGQQHSQEPKSP